MKIKLITFLNKSRIFEDASSSKFLPNFFVALVIFVLLWLGGRGVAALVPIEKVGDMYKYTKNFEAVIYTIRLIINGVVVMGAFFLWVKFIEKRRIATMGLNFNNAGKKYLRGFVIGLILTSSIVIIFAFLGVVYINPKYTVHQDINKVLAILLMLIGWAVNSAYEEIGIRGWLLPIIGTNNNGIFAIFITSTIFGCIHLFNPHVTIISFINLLLGGVFSSLYVLWEESLWGVFGFHCAFNWALGNIFGFEVSGKLPVGGSVISLKTKGSAVITGGYFGPEAGIVSTIFSICGIVMILWFIYKRKSCDC